MASQESLSAAAAAEPVQARAASVAPIESAEPRVEPRPIPAPPELLLHSPPARDAARLERLCRALIHELRGPLTTAQLAAQLMVERAPSRGGERSTQQLPARLFAALGRMGTLLSDYEDALALVGGDPVIGERATFDLGTVVRRVGQELLAAWPEHLIVPRSEAVIGTWSRGVVARGVRAMTSFALQHAYRSHAVTTLLTRAEHDHAEVVVRSACSLSQQEIERHLDPFVQAHGPGVPTVTPALLVARTCAEAHGGSLSVTSNAVDGTSITMRLPRELPVIRP